MRHLSIGLPLTLAVGFAAPAPSRAQEPTAAPTATCAEARPAAYDGCALFLEGRLLKRGALGTVIAKPGFWRPLPLIAEVGGDSAVRYARGFERNAFRGTSPAALVDCSCSAVCSSFGRRDRTEATSLLVLRRVPA